MERYKYYKSDFALIVTINAEYLDSGGTLTTLDNTADFIFRFWTTDREHPFVCSQTGGMMVNCARLADAQKIICFIDRRHQGIELAPGRLMLEAEFPVSDAHFEGDSVENVKRYYTTEVFLTDKPDLDGENDIETVISADFIRGRDGKSAYQAAVEAGYQGTEEQYNRSMLGAVEVDGILLGESSIPVFPTGLPYAQRTLFLRENVLYRAIEQITSSTWDATKATETNLFEEVRHLGEAANEQINVILTREGEDIATQFDSSSDYAIGEYVFYNGSLCRFTTAHAAGDAWDANEVAVMGSKAGVSVFFNVEGEANPRTVVTDANGRASTVVNKGLFVTISANAIQGYYNPDNQQIRAALPMRNVYIPYTTDISGDYENMLVTFSYADYPTDPSKASSITVNVFTDSTRQTVEQSFTVNVVNDEARFRVLHGKDYNIVFPSVSTYLGPGTIYFTAIHSNRQFTAYYIPNSIGLEWIRYDGSYLGVNQATLADESSIAGMVVRSSSVVPFIIPKDMIYADGKAWGRYDNNTPLTNCNENTALDDKNGYYNTQTLKEYYNAISFSSSMVNFAVSKNITINGVTYVGFIPSAAQARQVYLLKDDIQKYFNSINKAFLFLQGLTSTECSIYECIIITNNGLAKLSKGSGSLCQVFFPAPIE